MNTERLHAIARAVIADYANTEVPQLMDQLMTHLNAWAANPADANASNQVAGLREQLREKLSASRTNEFSDAWRLALEELDIWRLTGNRLLEHIEDVFSRHEITPSTAATEIATTNSEVQAANTALENLNSAFDEFGIGAEELAQGEFEVGFLIPRQAVDNELEQLGNEFEQLDKILGPFMELNGESRPDFQVRSISSSDFTVFVLAAPGLALTLAKVVESLLSSYEKIRKIRAQVASLEEDGVPPEQLDGLRSYANNRMEIDIEALTNQLVGQAQEHLSQGGRQFEMQMDVKRSITQIATRIDEGYSIEVRAFVPEEDEDAEEAEPDEVVEIAREITEAQPRMRSMNLTGQPILELPEGDDDEPPGEDEKPPPEAA